MWEIWDKTSDINGVSAERFMTTHPFLATEETIFIKRVGGRAVNVEGKSILASIKNIDPALDNDAFIAAYEAAIAPVEEEPTEAVEE